MRTSLRRRARFGQRKERGVGGLLWRTHGEEKAGSFKAKGYAVEAGSGRPATSSPSAGESVTESGAGWPLMRATVGGWP